METITLGEKLEILRVKKNLTRKELCSRINISAPHYSDLANNRVKKPNMLIMNRIAKELECDIEFLLKESVTFEADNIEIMKIYSEELRNFIKSIDNKPIIIFAKHATNMNFKDMCDEEKLLLVQSLENVVENAKYNSKRLL